MVKKLLLSDHCVITGDLPPCLFVFFAPFAVNDPIPNLLWLWLCRVGNWRFFVGFRRVPRL